jgi:uncharacterized membrane protein
LTTVGFVGLGMIQVAIATSLPDLQRIELPPWAARLSGTVLITCSLAMLAWRHRLAAAVAAGFFGCFAAIAFVDIAAGEWRSMAAWVPFAELTVFMAVALAGVSGRPGDAAILRPCFGSALILFGAVHVIYRDAISSMIPGWIPWVEAWPWFTGSIQLFAGIAVLWGRGSTVAATVIAFIYLSWLPLVHIPRLIGEPGNPQELTFALVAVALAGCSILIGYARGAASEPCS